MASVTASTIVHDISRQDLQELKTPASAFISSVKTLSSYNWIEAPKATPTIAVPGCPSLWSTPRIPQRLKKDSGLIYIAQNAARHPESPLEPLFRALFTTHSSFDIRPTDVVTDRNNIRKLLSFIDPSSSRSGLEEFTMNIELMKDTAILCRDEAKTVEYIGPHEFRGYGHEFEKAYTTAQISGSTGHHRIISYCFSDLNFIVRHETDGYVSADAGMSCSQTKIHSDDSLSTIFDALTLSPTSSSSGFRLIVKKEGQEVPLDSTLEIKTRVSHKPLDIQEIIPQLWASQTPKLVRAYHKNGTFQEPVVEDVTAAIKSWEERKQNDLRKLAALIREIISLVKKCGGKAVLKYNVMGDKLVICKVEGGEMLPKDLHAKWDDAHVRQREADTLNASMEEPAAPGQAMQESTSLAGTTKDRLNAKIKIGNVDYMIDVSKVPYFASFIQIQRATQPEAAEFIHKPISLFDVALKGLESGYRQCFRSLPTDLSQYRILFETYKFLQVDVLSGLLMDEVIANLKVGKADYDPEERRTICGNKSVARDKAFQLLYLILQTQHGDETRNSLKLLNAVMFVVSHPRTFKYRTRRVVRDAYEEQFNPTMKQRAGLDRWEKREDVNDVTDATTEEETDYYDSDWSF